MSKLDRFSCREFVSKIELSKTRVELVLIVISYRVDNESWTLSCQNLDSKTLNFKLFAVISVEINSIRTFDNSALDTNFRHEKQSSLDSNFRIEPSTRISLNSKVLTKVRQLYSNQKLTANCYQKLTANCYQKLTANCYQQFQSKVDSEMLSRVSVKSRHQKFQSKVDTESFSQKLTVKFNAKIVREVALRYCKQWPLSM